MKAMTFTEFVKRAREIHGDKYVYNEENYVNYKTYMDIFCPEHGFFSQTPKNHLCGYGCRKCATNRQRIAIRGTNLGIGFYDIENVVITPETKLARTMWRNMLYRCYDKEWLEKNSTYRGCYVCDEWLVFSNFWKWFKVNYIKGYELDKDILSPKDNKHYSPDTCCFIPHKLNTILLKCNKLRGDYPIGVNRIDNTIFSHVRIDGKIVYLGSFKTEKEAFNAYKKAKEDYVKSVAQKYYDNGEITKRVYDALMNYKINIDE